MNTKECKTYLAQEVGEWPDGVYFRHGVPIARKDASEDAQQWVAAAVTALDELNAPAQEPEPEQEPDPMAAFQNIRNPLESLRELGQHIVGRFREKLNVVQQGAVAYYEEVSGWEKEILELLKAQHRVALDYQADGLADEIAESIKQVEFLVELCKRDRRYELGSRKAKRQHEKAQERKAENESLLEALLANREIIRIDERRKVNITTKLSYEVSPGVKEKNAEIKERKAKFGPDAPIAELVREKNALYWDKLNGIFESFGIDPSLVDNKKKRNIINECKAKRHKDWAEKFKPTQIGETTIITQEEESEINAGLEEAMMAGDRDPNYPEESGTWTV